MERNLLVLVALFWVSSSDQAKNIRDALRRELGEGADTRTLQCSKADMQRGLIPGTSFVVNRTAREVDEALRIVLRRYQGVRAEVGQFEQIGVTGVIEATPVTAHVRKAINLRGATGDLGAFAADGVMESGPTDHTAADSGNSNEGTGNSSEGGPEVGDPKPPKDGTIQCSPPRLPHDADDDLSDDHAGGGAE